MKQTWYGHKERVLATPIDHQQVQQQQHAMNDTGGTTRDVYPLVEEDRGKVE